MGKLATFTRRAFLISSAAIAGGVAFGIYAVRKPHPNPLATDLKAGEATFNPWVKISAEKIVLITPHADLGQGVTHMQAMLIAEEMDLSPGQYETSFGEPSAAYYNRGLATEGGEMISHTTGIPAQVAASAMDAALKLMGMQLTGGSSAVPDSFDKLREAGAVARETLKAAAARRSGVDIGELRTANGAVILPNGTAIPYQQLAADAATIEPVTDVTLRDPSQWRLLGKPQQRLDMVAKSTGTQTFGIDLKFPGMVYASVRLSPRRSPLLKMDDTAARATPGVIDVIPVTNGVAVIGNNSWSVLKGARALQCEWAPAPYPAEQQGHWDALAASFAMEERLDAEWRNDGDATAAFASADKKGATVSAEYRAPYVAHQPMEPLNAVVTVTDSEVNIWASNQVPRMLQQAVAKVTGHTPEQVKFHNQYSGGSFGHRTEFDFIKRTAEIANTRRGTPVKLTYSREEDFAQDFPRHIAMARGQGSHRDGRVETLAIDVAAAPVLTSVGERMGQQSPGPDSQITPGIWDAPYNLPNFRVRAFATPGLAPVSSWRSVGASYGGFFLECFLDELILAAGADPVAERLRLINDPAAKACLETVAAMAGWGRDPGPNRGLGVALVKSFAVPVAQIIEVHNTPGGIRIENVWVAADVGTVLDPVNIENQIQGGIVWSLGHAINSEITYADGMAQQSNYHQAPGMRLNQCPPIHVKTLEISPRIHGIGEPTVPPAPAALANAIFAATGQRLREMPFNRFIGFV